VLFFLEIDCADDKADEAAERPHLDFRLLFLDGFFFAFDFIMRLKSFPLGGLVELRWMDVLCVSMLTGNWSAMVYSVHEMYRYYLC
jgi:hypothetical protein